MQLDNRLLIKYRDFSAEPKQMVNGNIAHKHCLYKDWKFRVTPITQHIFMP